MRNIIYLHPFLFLAASLLYLYPGSATISSPDQIARPLLALSFLLLVCAWFALFIKLYEPPKLAPLLTVFVLGVLSTPMFFKLVGAFLLALLSVWWLITRLRRRQMSALHANRILSLVSLVLVLSYARPYAASLALMREQAGRPIAPLTNLRVASSQPNIYYIVLDAYARADILDELYSFDNVEFIQFLRSRGFVIPSQSQSNYPKTVLSVTSTLNMDYIAALEPGLEDHPHWWLVAPYLDESRVRIALENIGYQSVSIATVWDLTDNPTTDKYYFSERATLTDFESHFIEETPLVMLAPVLRRFGLLLSYDAHRTAILNTFETLADVSKLAGPKFVFAHVFSPHPPFVFDADGNPIQPPYPFGFEDASLFPLTDAEYRDGYIAQVRFVNQKLMLLVDEILRESKTPPIIILQADHGPRMLGDFNSIEETCLRESFSTFSAYYLPGAEENIIPDDITPVNLFRIILNTYFSADLPLLESRNYYDQYGTLLVDVTDQVNSCSGR